MLLCPNSEGTIIAFSLKAMDEIIRNIKSITSQYTVKLSVYSDPGFRREVAHLMKELDVPCVTLCNTFPDVLELKEFAPTLNPKIKGIGLGGEAMRWITQGHVWEFRQILKPEQDIIAIGGVSTGEHVVNYQALGAKVVEMTTARAVFGRRTTRRVYEEYVNLRASLEEADKWPVRIVSQA